MSRLFKILGLLISLPFIYLAGAFTASNLQFVTVTLWPFEFGYEMPLALIVYAALMIGFAIGAIAAWIGAGRVRNARRLAEAQKRAQARKIQDLKSQLEEQAKALKLPAPGNDSETDVSPERNHPKSISAHG